VEKFETQVRKKDGTTIWVSIHANALKDGAGKTMSWAGIVEDISARKEMEEKLQKHTEEITDLYNNAPCGYHSLAPDGVFLLVNDTELQWLGYTRDEIIGRKNFADLITAESREAFHLNMLLLEKQGWVAEQKYELVRKDGTIFPVVVNSKVITDHEGKFAANRSTVFDITGLKQAEEELNRLNDNLEQRVEARTEELKKAKRVALSIMQDANIERERAKGMLEKLQASSEQLNILSNALEQSPSSVVITDREGQIEYVNPKFENLTGYSAKEALGSKPRILRSGVHGDAFYQNLWQTIMSGKEWHGEICNRKKDGQLYWEQASISAIRNNAGEIIKYVSVREDITERKHLDEKLKQQLEELERFNRLTIDREERMIELKKEINSLLKHTGEEEKYRIVEE
jgi:PAS domain S-box-containing protein